MTSAKCAVCGCYNSEVDGVCCVCGSTEFWEERHDDTEQEQSQEGKHEEKA